MFRNLIIFVVLVVIAYFLYPGVKGICQIWFCNDTDINSPPNS